MDKQDILAHTKEIRVHGHLVHDASLAIVVGVLLRVELVHHRWLSSGLVVVGVGAGVGMSTGRSAQSSTDMLWLASESIRALASATKGTALALELVHADGGKGRGAVVLGGIVVDFVDGDRAVNDVGFDGLLVDDRLDVLVNVVVNMLASDNGLGAGGVFALHSGGLVLELSGFRGKLFFVHGLVVVLERSVLNTSHLEVC